MERMFNFSTSVALACNSQICATAESYLNKKEAGSYKHKKQFIMFNFFKTKKQVVKDIPVPVQETFIPPAKGVIEAQIYNDVYSAQEVLLAEANAILAKFPVYDEQKENRLRKLSLLGFYNAEEVKEYDKWDSERRELESVKNKLEYYQREYPFNRFIDKKSVETICKKYGLYLTEVNNYIAEIPEKNQKEIVAFKVKRRDIPLVPLLPRASFTFSEEYSNEKTEALGLLIMAPENKIRNVNLRKNGYKIELDDPIVLQPVYEGYLIVSSWGYEAGDELVVNAINN